MERVSNDIEIHNALKEHAFTLSLSIGTAFYDLAQPCTIDEMLVKADAMMYRAKKESKNVEIHKDA